MKFVCPFSPLLSSAPAIGAPISDAILDTLHDIPSRVPKRDKSGVIFAKAAEGTVTRAAEKKPEIVLAGSFLSLGKSTQAKKVRKVM
jgi:hypothetical protein